MLLNTKLSTIIFIFIICTSYFTNCSEKYENNSANDNFENIIAELMIIENMAISDSLKAVLIIENLENNNTSIEKFRIHISNYREDPYYWSDAYIKIKQIIKEIPEQQKLEKKH